MQKILPPSMIAAGIAGASTGGALGFMNKGEELENQGATFGQQLSGSLGGGLKSGIVGGGIGLGISGTAVALKTILKK